MSPRPYRLGQRRLAADRTRARIVAAARALLTAEGGLAGFTVDAVARQASVSRMTVYYQFDSRAGLLDALFDDLAARGGLDQLAAAFGLPDPLAALDALIEVFCRFWASDRLLHRRLQGLTALDPEFEQASREHRRRYGLTVVLQRLAEATGRPAPGSLEQAVDVLHTLTGFHVYDGLAGGARGPDEVAALVNGLARAALGMAAAPAGGTDRPVDVV